MPPGPANWLQIQERFPFRSMLSNKYRDIFTYSGARRAYKLRFTIFMLLYIDLCSCNVNRTHSQEEELFDDLFIGYNPISRPVIDSNTSVQVAISLQLTNIIELNTKDQFLKLQGWITVTWKDEYLIWNASQYGGQEVIVVRPHKIWLPAFSPDNKLRGTIYDKDWYKLFRASIHHDGTVVWEPGGHFLSECETDVAYFPFDEQICSVSFANWVYNVKQVDLTVADTAKDDLLELFQNSGQWSVEDIYISRQELFYSCCKEPYPEIIYYLHLRRKSLFYFVHLIYVSILLAILTVVNTKVPPETGERIILGVSTLLAYILFILSAHQYVPATSQSVPIIVIYFVTSMFINCIAILESVFSALCYYRKNHKRAPKMLRIIVLRLITRGMCYPVGLSDDDDDDVIIKLPRRKRKSHTKQTSWKQKYTFGKAAEKNDKQFSSDNVATFRKHPKENDKNSKHIKAATCSKSTEEMPEKSKITNDGIKNRKSRKESKKDNSDVERKTDSVKQIQNVIQNLKGDVKQRNTPDNIRNDLNDKCSIKHDTNVSNDDQQPGDSIRYDNTPPETFDLEEPAYYPPELTRNHSIQLAEKGCLPTTDLPGDVIASIVATEIQRRQSERALSSHVLSSIEEENNVSDYNSDTSAKPHGVPQPTDNSDNYSTHGSDSDEIDYDFIESLLDSNAGTISSFPSVPFTAPSKQLSPNNTSGLYRKQTSIEKMRFRQERVLIKNLNASFSTATKSPMLKQLTRDHPTVKLDTLQKEMEQLNKWYEKEEEKRVVRNEWILIAQTLDLFFFWFLLLLYTLSIISILVMLPNLLVNTQIDKK